MHYLIVADYPTQTLVPEISGPQISKLQPTNITAVQVGTQATSWPRGGGGLARDKVQVS